jgi:hypothetical protein
MQDRPFEPDFVYDISEHWNTKKEAILAFNTQFNVDEPGNEPETYISSENYFKQLEARARYFGHLAGFTHGEAFKYYLSPTPLRSMDYHLLIFDIVSDETSKSTYRTGYRNSYSKRRVSILRAFQLRRAG